MTENMIPRRKAGGDEGFYTPDPVKEASRKAEGSRTWLSVDVVAITDDPRDPRIVLVRRDRDPHRGELTMPGVLLDSSIAETVSQAVSRAASDRGGVETVPQTLPCPVTVVSDPLRDERGHTVSVVAVARVTVPRESDSVLVTDGSELPDMPFGHTEMVRSAAAKVADRLLSDPDVAAAVFGSDGFTSTEAAAVLDLLNRAAARQDQIPSAPMTITRRIERNPMFIKSGKVPATTRPMTLYTLKGE